MRFAYIDSNGHEAPIPSVDALALRTIILVFIRAGVLEVGVFSRRVVRHIVDLRQFGNGFTEHPLHALA